MPIQYSLDKFGVPLDGKKQGPLLQPKIKYRFRARFLNFGGIGNQAIPVTMNVDSVTLPQIHHEEITVHSYNSVAYYAGKATFDTIELVVRDDVTNTVTRNIAAQEQLQFDHFNQTGYRAATNYKFTILIEIMDGGNDAVLEQWQGEGCFLVSINYGDVNYSANESKTISMTIRADNWTYADENGNLLMSTPSSDPQGRNL